MEYSELASWLEELDESVNIEEKTALIFLLKDTKPGAVIMGVSEGSKIYEFAEEFDLETLKVEGENRSLLNRLLGRDNRFQKDTLFLAQDDKQFDILEDEDPGFAGFTDESVGRFLGYPDNAVEYYSSCDAPGHSFREEVKEQDFEESDLKYLNLVFYVPTPEEEYIKDAVEEGKRRAEKLKEISDESGIDLYDQYREKLLEES